LLLQDGLDLEALLVLPIYAHLLEAFLLLGRSHLLDDALFLHLAHLLLLLFVDLQLLEGHCVDQLPGLGGAVGVGHGLLVGGAGLVDLRVEVEIALEVVDVLDLEGVAGRVDLRDGRGEEFLLELRAQVVLGCLPLGLLVENDPLDNFLLHLLLDALAVHAHLPVEVRLHLLQLRTDLLLFPLPLVELVLGALDGLHPHLPLDLLAYLLTVDFLLQLMLPLKSQLLDLSLFLVAVLLQQLLLNAGAHVLLQLRPALGALLRQLRLLRLHRLTH
jgi:hypothetical protein